MDMGHASSSSHPMMKYDVFLSFRGEDTRDNFTSHLYAALCQKKITTYMDLESEGEISSALLKAIENSSMSVVIFSENYAFSPWCLDELVHILECKERSGQIVVPIYYHVDPSSVRKQQGSYEAGLALLKSRYKDRLDKWTAALTSAANISGWDSTNISPESKLVERVVQDVIKKLERISPSDDFKGLVGVQKRVKQILSLLDIGSPNVSVVGIWGMGGIGKTTLARVVFNRIYFQFETCCFLENVREESLRNSSKYLQKKLYYELFEEHEHGDTMLVRFTNFHKDRLRRKNVLIVLDDVDEIEQLELLVGDFAWYSPGSRIIITSRDASVLERVGADAIYKVPLLDFDEAQQLFNLYAFKRALIPDDYIELSKSFVNYAKGSPLALKVLGSRLYCKNIETWVMTLHKLNRIPDLMIQNVLKISFDALGVNERGLFLDIACFFTGNDKDLVERILDSCWFPAGIGIQILIDKSLLTVDSNKLWMNDLIEKMGRQIVLEESQEPGRCSRLWSSRDIYHIFKYDTGTAAVEGIFLDMSRIKMVYLRPTAFSKMYNLRMLKLHSRFAQCILQFPEGLLLLPDALRYLYWDGYPFNSLPMSFTGENLVELKMQCSKVERLWSGVQRLENLKVIDLSFSKQLIEIPNLSQAPNVESLSLRFCQRLREVPCYFQDLDKLISLNLADCSSLDKVSALPRNIKDVNLTRCVSLKSLPSNISTFKSLKRLELSGCSNFDYMNTKILEFLESLQ